MTQYLDEYKPGAKGQNRQVQSDTQKLVGVHLTTATTGNPGEIKTVLGELKTAVGGGDCDAYLVATFSHHASGDLTAALEKIARTVSLCDVPPALSGGAEIDVKVELIGGRPKAYVRPHAVLPARDCLVVAGEEQKRSWNALVGVVPIASRTAVVFSLRPPGKARPAAF